MAAPDRSLVANLTSLSRPIVDYYRCSTHLPAFQVAEGVKESNGFFRFGSDVICYGRTTSETSAVVDGELFDASTQSHAHKGTVFLPFDFSQVFDNLRYERYVPSSDSPRWLEKSLARQLYYRLRPLLPSSLRRRLQRFYLRDWDRIAFPSWPVDRNADVLFEKLLVLVMRALETDRLPFIWFWPYGHSACAVVTHDVETKVGRDFSQQLMDIDDSFGIKSSFQIVPEKRYPVPDEYLASIRERGFELNVHGLDHDGNLFQNREAFMQAAVKINEYARQYGSRGFRSPVLYRNVDWLQKLAFSYDMSVPSVARLEAQRGGCCTIMPYFLPGNVLELPLTMAEDYSLFYILNEYSCALWKRQMKIILDAHGLLSFIIHPDYIQSSRNQGVYKTLLGEIDRLREDHGVWVALPGEVDTWWRQRDQMTLVPDGKNWTIEGAGSEKAALAYATLDGDRLKYCVEAIR